MKEKFNFTKREIEKLPPAMQGKRAYYYDTKVFGLELMITSTGSKSFKVLTLPLVEDALKILKARKKNSTGNYVFEGEGRTGHLADPRKAWVRILKKAGIEDLRLHDLRRSLGSYQAILGANSYTIGKSLGHKSQAATAIYARMNLDPVRASMEAATRMMRGVC